MFEGSEAFRISALDYGIYYFLHGHGHLVSFVTFIALCATFFLRNTYHCMVLKLQVDLGFFCHLLLLGVALSFPQSTVADIDVHATVDFDDNV